MKKGQELSSWPRPRATGLLHWCFVHFKIGGTASLAHRYLLPYQGIKNTPEGGRRDCRTISSEARLYFTRIEKMAGILKKPYF